MEWVARDGSGLPSPPKVVEGVQYLCAKLPVEDFLRNVSQ